MRSGDLCRVLTWDSAFFRCRVGRVDVASIGQGRVKDVLAWARKNRIDCLYYLADSADAESIEIAESHDFRFVDIRTTLAFASSLNSTERESGAVGEVRPWRVEEADALCEIARVSHRDSRFYADPNFPRERCDTLFETWIRKSCDGYADVVLVAECKGKPSGYVTCHIQGEGKGTIGLLAVHHECRGVGLGTQLVREAQSWFAERGVKTLSVVTQGKNVGAQKLYQSRGFRTEEVQLWFHRWSGDML